MIILNYKGELKQHILLECGHLVVFILNYFIYFTNNSVNTTTNGNSFVL